ncbi:hypothetical protein KIN20_031794 [Parelaphostrongylus tenuis]|uniref:Uncharacterized protein n=1 Tax=Parelaphostrongylus tenuis TaxID=148309 RepID=A0AAD5WH94_PARTN|nr:hypothetical protein KIN20_031794 [Parelaphostrongylus tenuis]
MGALEIVIFNIGMLFSILAHCCAWAIHIQVTRISEFVMQLSAEQLRFDADVNEFERDVAVLMVKDPQSTYTAETMTRPNKPKITAVENKLGSSNRLPKRKAVRNKGDENEEPGTHEKTKEASVEDNDPIKSKFKAPSHITKVDAKDPQYETLRGIGKDLFAGDKSEEKEKKDKNKKFKEPAKVQKADAKDPQYETMADVKDDIFKG